MILDACCGPKEMYRGLHRQFTQDEIIFIDKRLGDFDRTKWGIEPLKVEPDIQADIKHLPFKDGSFNIIIFDPPHGSFTLESFLGVKYGGMSPRELRDLLIRANVEFNRVLIDGGVVFAKIMEVEDKDYMLEKTFTNFKYLMRIRYGSQRAIKTSKAITVWMLMVKKISPM
jgi:tRNA G10  N-methylase Trm11